jgi:multiple sugar transport system permease protein
VSGDALPLPLTGSGRRPSTRARRLSVGISKLGVTLFTASLAMIFLLPLGYMILTSVKDNSQITALNAPLWPASPELYTAADGQSYQLYSVPLPDGRVEDLALVKPGRIKSTFIDPGTGQEVSWEGNWRGLSPAWSSINPKFDNFTTVLDILNFPMLLRNTLVVAILGTIGAVSSAVVVAYGFARFRIPGRDGLFLVMIMTIMLPFQVLLIPQYIGFRAVGWTGSWLPLIVPRFYANAYNVFL